MSVYQKGRFLQGRSFARPRRIAAAAIFFLIFSHRKYMLRSGASEEPGIGQKFEGKFLLLSSSLPSTHHTTNIMKSYINKITGIFVMIKLMPCSVSDLPDAFQTNPKRHQRDSTAVSIDHVPLVDKMQHPNVRGALIHCRCCSKRILIILQIIY